MVLLAEPFYRAKCLVMVTAFPNTADTPSPRDFLAVMYYDYRQGKSFQQCLQSLSNYFGIHSSSSFTDDKWYKECRLGRTTVEDSDRCGRRVTVAT